MHVPSHCQLTPFIGIAPCFLLVPPPLLTTALCWHKYPSCTFAQNFYLLTPRVQPQHPTLSPVNANIQSQPQPLQLVMLLRG
ncbi:hypothetical protein N656DRAFT_777230 [Canariomyces notabilis]|uniref:Uncharacterized protein n=1 Tax=Canariomyces notabilis TaxID=2074819 RepID=A0AAN6TGJ9_9PEZI|nr:hypothetical protein N656DRAFT_777230 [Canariomyces arenarius]